MAAAKLPLRSELGKCQQRCATGLAGGSDLDAVTHAQAVADVGLLPMRGRTCQPAAFGSAEICHFFQ
jgi:hypothetical protein